MTPGFMMKVPPLFVREGRGELSRKVFSRNPDSYRELRAQRRKERKEENIKGEQCDQPLVDANGAMRHPG